MTPLQIIILIWSVGTCIATFILLYKIEETDTYKRLINQYGSIYTPQFIMILFCISAFVNSLLWWWLTIPQMLIEWIRSLMIMWVVNKILKMAKKGKMNTTKARQLLDMIRQIYSEKNDQKEEKKDKVV